MFVMREIDELNIVAGITEPIALLFTEFEGINFHDGPAGRVSLHVSSRISAVADQTSQKLPTLTKDLVFLFLYRERTPGLKKLLEPITVVQTLVSNVHILC